MPNINSVSPTVSVKRQARLVCDGPAPRTQPALALAQQFLRDENLEKIDK